MISIVNIICYGCESEEEDRREKRRSHMFSPETIENLKKLFLVGIFEYD